MRVRIPPVSVMDDETLMKHLEHRHENDLAMRFIPEPGRNDRRLHAPTEWRTYHETLHRNTGDSYNHVHNEE